MLNQLQSKLLDNKDGQHLDQNNLGPVASSDEDIMIVREYNPEAIFFRPLELEHQKTICTKLKLTLRNKNMIHTEVGYRLDLEQYAPKIRRVRGDGNCLFRALSVAVTGYETAHAKIRQLICSHIELFGTLDNSGDGSRYLEESGMSEETTWGTDIEIYAAAQVLTTDIYVYHKYGSQRKWLLFPCISLGSFAKKVHSIYLDNRSGDGNYGHYDYVTGINLKI